MTNSSNEELVECGQMVWDQAPFLSRWRHRNGGVYKVVGIVTREADLVMGILYLPVDAPDGMPPWMRPADEFLDGRFERVE